MHPNTSIEVEVHEARERSDGADASSPSQPQPLTQAETQLQAQAQAPPQRRVCLSPVDIDESPSATASAPAPFSGVDSLRAPSRRPIPMEATESSASVPPQSRFTTSNLRGSTTVTTAPAAAFDGFESLCERRLQLALDECDDPLQTVRKLTRLYVLRISHQNL